MTTAYVGPNGQWVSRADTPNPADAPSYTNLTASGVVSARPGSIAIGYVVTTALSAAAITVYDNASAASGAVLFVIPASTAAGAAQSFGDDGIIAANGIYASFGGTGTVNFLYK